MNKNIKKKQYFFKFKNKSFILLFKMIYFLDFNIKKFIDNIRLFIILHLYFYFIIS